MKIDLEKVSKLQRKLNVEVPLEVVVKAMEKIYLGLQKQVAVKGFRKGKVPITTIKGMYKERVHDEVVRDLIQEYYVRALTEHNLEPIGNPTFEFDPLQEGSPFKFTAKLELRPEVELKLYEGLMVEKEKFEANAELVEKTLERLRESNATSGPMLENRPAQMSDLVIVDFEGVMEGKKLDNAAAQKQTIELGSSTFIEGFDAGIVGMKVGETRVLNLVFPMENYPADLAGKPVTFTIHLHDIQRKVLPHLNDEFAAKLGPFKSIDELKQAIRDEQQKEEEVRIRKNLKTSIMKALVAANPMDVPPGILAEQKKTLMDDIHHKMEQQGMTHAQFEDYAKKWDGDFEESARFIIQSSFLVNALAEKMNFKATEEDVEKRLEEYAKSTGIALEKLHEYYKETDRRSNLRFQMTEERVVDLLIEKARIKEVPRKKED